MMSKRMQSVSCANSGLQVTSAVSCYRQDSSLKADPSMGSRRENNMAVRKLLELTGGMNVRDEIRKAQQNRSKRTRRLVQEAIERRRFPAHLRPRRQFGVPTLEELLNENR